MEEKKKLKISQEELEIIFNLFKNKNPDISEEYKISNKRKGIVALLNKFIRKHIAGENNFTRLNVSNDTTRKLARSLLDHYLNNPKNSQSVLFCIN